MAKKQATTPDAPPEEQVLGPGELMDVRMRGSADKIRRQLGIGHEPKAPQEETQADAGRAFAKLLRNPKYIVVIKRTKPKDWDGVKCDIELPKYDLPMGFSEITEDVARTYGGERYRMAIVDPATGDTIDARPFTVEGPPIIQRENTLDNLFDEGPGNEPPPESPLDQVAEATEKQLKLALRTAELEQAKEAIHNISSRREKPVESPAVAALQRQLEEMKKREEARSAEERFRAELKASEERHAREMAELKALIKDSQGSRKDPLLEMLVAQQKSSDEKFQKLIEQMNNDRMTVMLNEIRELKNKKDDGSFEKQLTLFKSFADLAGIDLPGGGGDEDDKEWYEKLVDHIPKILETVGGKKSDGKEVTKEDLVKEIERVADEEIAKRNAAGRIPMQTRPPAAAAPSQPPPSASIPSAPGLPSAPPPSGPAIPTPQIPSVEQETAIRIAGVLSVLDREVLFRPRLSQWSYAAWQNLPEDNLERFASAGDLPSALSTFEGIVPPEEIAKLKSRIMTDAKVSVWSARGFKELRGWWERAKLDPDFDPSSEDEDEDEEEEGDAGEGGQ